MTAGRADPGGTAGIAGRADPGGTGGRVGGGGVDAAAARAAELEYAGRLLEREGIPMVLALVDETGAGPPVLDPATLADGAAHAELLAAYRAVLRPDAADDDAPALQDVLAVLSWTHRPGATPPPRPGPPAPGVPAPGAPAPGAGGPGAAPAGVVASFGGHAAALQAGRFLRVINYHNTPAGSEDQLERELAAYLEHFDPVGPADLDAFLDTGGWPLPRPGFVAAFYDGYHNNATVAAPVCDRLGLRAWFLPPTGFLAAGPAEHRWFAARHDVDLLEEELDQDRLAMTWDDLAAIGARHVVAAHTATHAALAEVAADPDGELVGPRRRLAAVTGTVPTALALRLGAPYDPYDPTWQAARAAGYRYVVSNTAIQRISRAPDDGSPAARSR